MLIVVLNESRRLLHRAETAARDEVPDSHVVAPTVRRRLTCQRATSAAGRGAISAPSSPRPASGSGWGTATRAGVPYPRRSVSDEVHVRVPPGGVEHDLYTPAYTAS